MHTRSGRSTAPLAGRPATSEQYPCPVDNCNSFLAPTNRGDSAEYSCFVGGHGRIALEQNGRIVVVAPVVLAADGGLKVLANRPRCSHPQCDQSRRAACGRQLCGTHCGMEATNCGCSAHDDERGAIAPAALAEQPGEQPPPSQPADPWDIIGWVNNLPIRAAPAPMQTRLMLRFSDQRSSTFAIVAGGRWCFDLASLDADAKILLEWDNILPGSLEYIDGEGEWTKYVGGDVPVFPSLIPDSDGIGDLSLRAGTVPDLSQFPLAMYVDTVSILEELAEFTSHPRNMTIEEAYRARFQHEPTADDLASICVCREVLQTAPLDIRERFKTRKYHPTGSWRLFVKACEAAAQVDELASPGTRALFLSPLVNRQRRPRGKSTRPPSPSPSW